MEELLRPRFPLAGVDYADPATARRWLELGAWVPETIGEVIERAARENGSKLAIISDDARLTYTEVERRSGIVARHFLDLGLEPGDRVLVQVGINSDAAMLLLGLFRAGLLPVCAVPQYRDYEMGALAAASGAVAHAVAPAAGGSFDLVALFGRLREAHPQLRHLVVIAAEAPRGATALGTWEEDHQGAIEVATTPVDLVAFQLSGGTTNVPKIIPRHHAEYLGYAGAWADRIGLTAQDVMLWPLPISHNAGMLCFLMPALLRQATLVLVPRFIAADFLGVIERERVTVTGSVGPIAPRLLEMDFSASFDLASVRLFIALNRAAEIENHLGINAMNFYGTTEGVIAAPAPDAPADARHNTVGNLVSPHDEMAILVPGGEDPVEPGEIGELCFRGPSTLRAYYGNAEATAAAFTESGFFRSGDLVHGHTITGDAYISFEGRLKDNIDRGGEKFGTEEIEALIAQNEAIREARVVGMPDRYLGERVCAFVIPTPGAEIPGVEALGAFLLERGLAKFKLPERIEAIEGMPVTRVGKLDRQELRRLIAEKLSAEEAG